MAGRISELARDASSMMRRLVLGATIGSAFLGTSNSFAETQSGPLVDLDVDKPPDTTRPLGAGFSWGADAELDVVYHGNRDLADPLNDRVLSLNPQLEVALGFQPNPRFQAFTSVEISRMFQPISPAGTRRPATRLELVQAYATLNYLRPGVALQVGRQDFQDEREWFYDEELDGFRLFYTYSRFALELSATRQDVFKADILNADREERINNLFLVGHTAVAEAVDATIYALYRDDRIKRSEELLMLGFGSAGSFQDGLDYWLNAAVALGRSNGDDIRGFGFDAGLTRVWDARFQPSFSAGVAFGTGDGNDGDGVDHGFRQTGLQDNNGAFNGVTTFRYYGEVLDPELSNLRVVTAVFGLRPSPDSSVDLVYHRYRQHRARDDLRDSNLTSAPSGRDRDVGDGLDLVIGFHEHERVRLELVLGAFFPGAAFPGADSAYRGAFEVKYEF